MSGGGRIGQVASLGRCRDSLTTTWVALVPQPSSGSCSTRLPRTGPYGLNDEQGWAAMNQANLGRSPAILGCCALTPGPS
jgi:hypothetical protein